MDNSTLDAIDKWEPVWSCSGQSKACFAHPADQQHLEKLKQVPGIEWASKQLGRYSYEKLLRLQHCANSLKVTEECYEGLHQLFGKICAALDVPCPDLFVEERSQLEARVIGLEEPFVVVTTTLLETLPLDQVIAALVHQVSHVYCDHLWYLLVCDFVRDVATELGLLGTPLLGVRLALEEWRRRAQLSCDRGALLICGGLEPVQGWLLHMAGGGLSRFGKVPAHALQKQAQSFESLTHGISLNRLYRIVLYLNADHTFASLRVGELKAWSESEAYRALLEGAAPQGQTPSEDEIELPFWGAFVQEDLWSHEPPRGDAGDQLIEGLKGAASGAAGMVQQGAEIFQNSLEGLLDGVFKNSPVKDR